MARFFNTTRPCNPDDHYMLPPEKRVIRAQLDRYIQSKLYWVLHAPRQTGKTTFLISRMKAINAGGKAVACYVSVERCQELPSADEAIPAICAAIRSYTDTFLGPDRTPPEPEAGSPIPLMLNSILKSWSALVAPKPLVGMRNLRDYLVQSKDGVPLNPGSPGCMGEQRAQRVTSPFNIKEDNATLSQFTLEDIRELVGQHVSETGQKFEQEAIEAVRDAARGQPWLVNALCKKCTWTLCPAGERITVAHIHEARELLIQERAVHLDSLAERLRDPRVKRVVQSIITGAMDPNLTEGDDFRLSLDMDCTLPGVSGFLVAPRGHLGGEGGLYQGVSASAGDGLP